ncbi:hypothetical protein [Pseudomonas sp.]|uniref:hypothetical protein n=1 Tax=Pseudomonas sp. TaxID=306 RepID=UPI002587DC02|nr:hypothetical protein [Pseudomonas sp.]
MKDKTERKQKIETLINHLILTILMIVFFVVANVYFNVPLSTLLTILALSISSCATAYIIANTITIVASIFKRRLKEITEFAHYGEKIPYKPILKDICIILISSLALTAVLLIAFEATVKLGSEPLKQIASNAFIVYLGVMIFFIAVFSIVIAQLAVNFLLSLFKIERSSDINRVPELDNLEDGDQKIAAKKQIAEVLNK